MTESLQPCQRQSYPSVAVEALGIAIDSELDLENYPNGSAGITGCGRLFRITFRALNNFLDLNSKNIAKSKGCKWEAIGPVKFFTDKGLGDIYVDPGVDDI